MPNHTHARIQVNHTVQTTTNRVVENQVAPDTSVIKIIGVNEFCELFYANPPPLSQTMTDLRLQNASLFWAHLFGHIGWAVHHGHHKKATYLTEESAHMILQNYEKFVSGFDFYHRSRGFLMVKNPQTGIMDVLHYSSFLHQLQKESPPNYLAINMDAPDATELPALEVRPFQGMKNTWFMALQQKRVLENGQATCTEQELRSAFIRFSQTLEEMGLEFYPPQFDSEFLEHPVNPIVLLARWETVLRNRHLKVVDRKTQWDVMLNLRLESGDQALRALSDHENDTHPCGILLPEMHCVKDDFYENLQINTVEYKNCWGFRSVIDPKKIRDIKDFWRYIAFQPQRHSVQFYREALQAIQEITLVSDESKLQLMQMLAGGATRFNAAKNSEEEIRMLTIWKEVCDIIGRWETMNTLLFVVQMAIPDQEKSRLRNDLVYHLCRLSEPPNIEWFNMIFGHIKHFFSRAMNAGPLLQLSDNLNTVVGRLKLATYQGAKFLCTDEDWLTRGIKEYVELQAQLCQIAGPFHVLLAAHLSTFNIKKADEIQYCHDLHQLQIPNQALLIFALKILEDIQTNNGLQWRHLHAICQALASQRLNTEMEVLSYLEENFAHVFIENYFFEKKQQVLIAHSGLNAEQIAFIDKLNFSPEQTLALKRILSKVKGNIPLISAVEMQNLALKFNDFTQVFTSSDVSKFLNNLADMADSITNLEEINNLLDLLMEKRKFTDFEHIYFCNKIIQNKENLIDKFTYYVNSIQYLVETYPVLDQASVQEMVATYILNAYDNFSEEALTGLLQNLELIIRANPHIQNYIFLSLQNIPGSNTPGFIPNTHEFVHTLTLVHNLLATNDGMPDIKNMQIFYSLLAKYAKNPQACVHLFKILQNSAFEPAKLKFTIHLMSRLLEQNQPLDIIQSTTEFIVSLSPEQYQQFIVCYQNPPYPPLQMWQEWAREPETLLNKYNAFSLIPFGPRKLEYTFNLDHYHHQKTLFKGLIRNGEPFSPAIFTDELGQHFKTLLDENRQKSIPDLQQTYTQACVEQDKVTMLCAAIELLARTTSQKDLDSDRQISQEINTTQVMAAYTALLYPNMKLQMEMDTGEGKSRVMMVLAACKSSLGLTPDFITSDFPLAERDYFAYKSFMTTLDIPTSLITLATPELLYQHRGVNFSDNEQLQLARNKSDIDGRPFAFLNPNPELRCLLIDEVDKFKKDKSKYACNFAAQSIKFGEFTWIYPHLVKFMQHPRHRTQALQKRAIYQGMTDDFLRYLAEHDPDPIRVAQLSALNNMHPEQLSTWLHSADFVIKKMTLNDDYAITEQLFPNVDGEGNVRMSQKILVLNNGRPAEGALFADGMHQCLIALLNIIAGHEQYVIPQEVETQRTSYPSTFMGKYEEGQTIGASGTTRSAGPIADPVINYDNYGYLSVPRERPLQRDHKQIWAAKDQSQQIQFIKRAILKKLAKGLPTLVICKDDNQSLALYNALSNDLELTAAFTRVHGLSTPEEEKTAIQQAGQARQITFSTAGMFSRGVDIEAGNLFVIAAYVPTFEDEIQIMGRTSRAGKPGEYRMIPDLSDEDAALNGNTYNIHNEVDKYQKSLAVEAEFQEDVSIIYGLFLEEITQNFLNTRPGPEETELWLVRWQSFLHDMQKNWENHSDSMLESLEKNNKEQFIAQLDTFIQRWLTELTQVFPSAVISEQSALQEKAAKIFDSAIHQLTFFQPKRHTLKVQHAYDPSDDGQARIYDTLFAQTAACLRGERRWFADYHAWREGRGVLFPNLMATLKGERPLFATLIATIQRWLKEWKEFYQACVVANAGAEEGRFGAPILVRSGG